MDTELHSLGLALLDARIAEQKAAGLFHDLPKLPPTVGRASGGGGGAGAAAAPAGRRGVEHGGRASSSHRDRHRRGNGRGGGRSAEAVVPAAGGVSADAGTGSGGVWEAVKGLGERPVRRRVWAHIAQPNP